MVTRDKNESNITLLEAVEALSSIADLELDRDVGIAQKHDLTLLETPLTYRTVHWLHRQGADETVQMVKEIFRVILNYLKDFYDKQYQVVTKPQTVEGIKTIMVLVGEAAKKLDRYTQLFHQTKTKSVTELKEYKQLQEFYLSRIARKVDEGLLGKWLLELTKRAWEGGGRLKLAGKPLGETKHIFVDLDSIRKDSDYELLILRKEDGSRFYSPKLIRNIKLLCDFGEYFPNSKVSIDPLEDVAIWKDRMFHFAAKELLAALNQKLDRFYKEALRYKEKEFVENLNKALIGLMLAAHAQNLRREDHLKCCTDYFADFLHYFRSALRSEEYHKMITYPPKPSNQVAHIILNVVHTLSYALIEKLNLLPEIASFVQGIVREAKENQSPEHEKAVKENWSLTSALSCDEAALMKLFKHHAYKPLVKMLDLLHEGGIHAFDPLMQQHLPYCLYSLGTLKQKVVSLQLPSPTMQEFIHRAAIADEFKGFLRACLKENSRHLLINLQDRTSWREHARCASLEALQHVEEFDNALTVVTLAKDTEFYHQLAPYAQETHADLFLQHFKDHLQDSSSGFYFPVAIANQLFPQFLDGVMDAIHRVFFSHRNVLSKDHRLDFIEIFYLFLQLKLIEIVKADSFSLTCKDGVDVGPAANGQLYAFMKLISQEKITEAERDRLNLIIHAPALMWRERPILAERFNRMMSAIKCVESARMHNGEEAFPLIIQDAFGDYFKGHFLKALVLK